MSKELNQFLPRTLRIVYLKEKNGNWLAKPEVSEFAQPAPPDFGALHDPHGNAPIDQWLTPAQIREANRVSRIWSGSQGPEGMDG